MTARVQKAFLSFFSICLDLFDFFDLFADLARACLGFLERPSRSSEFVRVRSSRYGAHNLTGALFNRPGDRARLDLAVDSGSRHVRASLRDVSNEIELN